MTYFTQCVVWVVLTALTGETVGQSIRVLKPRGMA